MDQQGEAFCRRHHLRTKPFPCPLASVSSDLVRDGLFTPEASREISAPVGRHITELFENAGQRGALNRCLYVDVKSYLSDNILTKVDRMSMAVSLETRVPYLDVDMVELAFRVPRPKVTEKRNQGNP